jgi:hypothetical protein
MLEIAAIIPLILGSGQVLPQTQTARPMAAPSLILKPYACYNAALTPRTGNRSTFSRATCWVICS